jgi:segregation and condensation protein A
VTQQRLVAGHDDLEAPQADGETLAEAPPSDDSASEARGAFVLQLPVFEGPLALLLHLLEQEELDITEVSLRLVTEQYLAHLRDADRLNLDKLAEFIGVGARLLLLKSRALLPRDPEDAPVTLDDEDDPENLVRALQEYRRFKQAAEHLRSLEAEHRTAYRRSAPPPELPLPPGLEGVTLASLVELFTQVLTRVPEDRPARAIPRPRVRLADRIRGLVERLDRDGRASFLSLLGDAPTRTSVIVEFLAVLELIKVRYLAAEQGEVFGDIDLVRLDGAVAPTAISPELDRG